MDVQFYLDAVEKAIESYRRQEIMNTDQGSLITWHGFSWLLLTQGIRMNMDGRRVLRDDDFVECLRRSVKYGEVYLYAHG